MKKRIYAMKEKIKFAIVVVLNYLYLFQYEVSAGSLSNSVLVSGTKKLIDDVTSALMILIPLIASVLAAMNGLKISGAQDDERPALMKKVRISIIAAICGIAAPGIIKIILGYYSTK